MADDRPLGCDTVKLEAMFVPEGNPGQISKGDITDALGYDVVTIPAIFIPDGSDAPRPGYPYENFGRFVWKPLGGAGELVPAQGDPGGGGPTQGPGGPGFGASGSSTGNVVPPTPTLAEAPRYFDPVPAGVAVLRGTQQAGAGWQAARGAFGMPQAAQPAPGPAPDAAGWSPPAANPTLPVAAVADPRHDDPTHQRVASRDQSGKPAQRPDDDPLTYDQIRALVAANNHSGQSDELIIAMAYKESRFRPNAQNLHSTVGGLLGLTDQAIEDVQTYFGANRDIDRHNPAQDIDAGSRYLALLISRAHGDVPQALARYGTGRAYATAVMKTASALKAGSPNPMQVLRQYIGKP